MTGQDNAIQDYLVKQKTYIESFMKIQNPVLLSKAIPGFFIGQNDFLSMPLNDLFNQAVRPMSPSRWTYVVGDANANTVGAISIANMNGSFQNAGMEKADYHKDILTAIKMAEDHAAALNELPDIRSVFMPAMGVLAIWHKGAAGDAFIPYHAIPKPALQVMNRDIFHDFLKNPPPSGNICPIPARP